MPARIWICIWRPRKVKTYEQSWAIFFYKFQGIPLSVGTELGVSLGGRLYAPPACRWCTAGHSDWPATSKRYVAGV